MDGMRGRVAGRLGSKPPTRPPAPVHPSVSLSKLRAAAHTDPPQKGTPVSYKGTEIYEAALVNEGLLAKARLDGHFGSDTVHATTLWQERLGFRGRQPGQPADGI